MRFQEAERPSKYVCLCVHVNEAWEEGGEGEAVFRYKRKVWSLNINGRAT